MAEETQFIETTEAEEERIVEEEDVTQEPLPAEADSSGDEYAALTDEQVQDMVDKMSPQDRGEYLWYKRHHLEQLATIKAVIPLWHEAPAIIRKSLPPIPAEIARILATPAEFGAPAGEPSASTSTATFPTTAATASAALASTAIANVATEVATCTSTERVIGTITTTPAPTLGRRVTTTIVATDPLVFAYQHPTIKCEVLEGEIVPDEIDLRSEDSDETEDDESVLLTKGELIKELDLLADLSERQAKCYRRIRARMFGIRDSDIESVQQVAASLPGPTLNIPDSCRETLLKLESDEHVKWLVASGQRCLTQYLSSKSDEVPIRMEDIALEHNLAVRKLQEVHRGKAYPGGSKRKTTDTQAPAKKSKPDMPRQT